MSSADRRCRTVRARAEQRRPDGQVRFSDWPHLLYAMRENVAWSLRAGAGLAVAAFVIGVYWVLYDRYRELGDLLADGVQLADFGDHAVWSSALLLGLGTATAVAVGSLLWWVIVEQWDRSSITRRGSLAGGLTGALVPYLVTAMLVTYSGLGSGLEPRDAIIILLVGLIGLFVVGWISVPAGTMLGYLFALRRGDGVTPIWRSLRRRFE